MAAAVARAIVCEAAPQRAAPPSQQKQQTRRDKIVLQPRLSTLRSYGADGSSAVTRKRLPGEALERGAPPPFFASLADYIESSRKSQDFETISGRLAMVAFAAAVAVEATTGDSLFKKLDTVQIEEATGLCLAVVASAATFAWVSSARDRIGQMLTLGCTSFVDGLIDNVVDVLFSDDQMQDWSDDA
uniref:Stress enhanced protein 2, chloroplastic n=1 Tax=Aegilops tauschii TaxID=37682 RepID=M8BT47_AEGTA